ncbi:MAG TPA: hypothetical protein VFP72_08995 [Kineosporiaceae bacterium]|nr:hypothetical protein [Kineosporiaceae bacterium]
MRVYLPTTLPRLAAAAAAGAFAADGDTGLVAHAVTHAVREWYTEGDLEELEYTALVDAAQGCLRLLADEPDSPRRRVVVAADVPEGSVRPVPDEGRSRVALTGPVRLSAVASVHLDEPEAAPTVTAAVEALPAADAGDDDARFAVDEAEACDLLWYDVSEIAHLT